ncbi:hypothetical protein GA0115255_123092 [Streptomyces sp. Ncost-T6T-2b]|nr:hypothetical protein GA0115255_123092 [Streptomyces sp. Ncost-T6T-2b]
MVSISPPSSPGARTGRRLPLSTARRCARLVEEPARVPLAQGRVLLRMQDERVQPEVHVVRRNHGNGGGGSGDQEGHGLVRDPLGTLGRLPVVDDHEVGEAFEQLLTGHRATGPLIVRRYRHATTPWLGRKVPNGNWHPPGTCRSTGRWRASQPSPTVGVPDGQTCAQFLPRTRRHDVVRQGIPFRAAADRPYLDTTADLAQDDADTSPGGVLRQSTDAWPGLLIARHADEHPAGHQDVGTSGKPHFGTSRIG